MNNPKEIILHHSATRDSGTVSWSAIRKYHTIARGWKDIGYHAGIELIGANYECLIGRPTTMWGAHTRGRNADTLGFCFVGNYNHASPPAEMMHTAARRVLAPWMEQFSIGTERISLHSNYASYKSCPGEKFDLGYLLYILQEYL
jgi:N-acetylmuramoyl-L-alanine amidase